MKKLIKLNKKYEFCFLEDKSIKIIHPVADYYMKLDDLSVNLLISFKWLL
jgi:hypothetical protein